MTKPYLFYWEEAVNAWVPAPDDISGIIDVEGSMEPGEIQEIQFKRVDLTQHQYDNLPDAD